MLSRCITIIALLLFANGPIYSTVLEKCLWHVQVPISSGWDGVGNVAK